MKVLETKTFRVITVEPENEKENKSVKKIIEKIENDESEFKPDEWELLEPGEI